MPVGCVAAAEHDAATLERLWRDSGAIYVEHHPVWARLTARADQACFHTVASSSPAGLDCYTLITESGGALLWMMGELSIHRRPIQRLHIVGGQVYAAGMPIERRRERARELLGWLFERA